MNRIDKEKLATVIVETIGCVLYDDKKYVKIKKIKSYNGILASASGTVFTTYKNVINYELFFIFNGDEYRMYMTDYDYLADATVWHDFRIDKVNKED